MQYCHWKPRQLIAKCIETLDTEGENVELGEVKKELIEIKGLLLTLSKGNYHTNEENKILESLLNKTSLAKTFCSERSIRSFIFFIHRFLQSDQNELKTSDEVAILLAMHFLSPTFYSQEVIKEYKETYFFNIFMKALKVKNYQNFMIFQRVKKSLDEGYDIDGYDPKGYDRNGYDREGFNCKGLDSEGYDREGYNSEGLNRNNKISAKKFSEIILSATYYSTNCTNYNISELYSNLDDSDTKLARLWNNNDQDNFQLARMLSARAAEKLAAQFYKSLGHSVKDVSSTQLENIEKEWIKYDLMLDEKEPIDVKNARTPINSNGNYTEHCVSSFKNDRNGENIKICGVLSPYISLENFKNLPYPYREESILFLGETSFNKLKKLEFHFSSRLLKLHIRGENYIPRWAFEYPEEFYFERNNKYARIRSINLDKVPSLSDCEINPIPIYLSSAVNIPENWTKELEDWQINFYNRLKPSNGRQVSLPVLFLALLTHFLEAISTQNGWAYYDPLKYKELLFANTGNPLGIHDPLNVIDEFIDTLNTLWNHRNSIKLNKFEHFKFNGRGLLEGKRVNDVVHITLLAYCGGFIEGFGKCGYSPLILGENETCANCGKLICERCGHCSTNCTSCKERMNGMLTRQN